MANKILDKVKAIFNKPDRMGVDMQTKIFEVKPNHICDMCGENIATCVILDPNIFPNNDLSKREDYWDVCDGCHEFVNWGMGKTIETQLELVAEKNRC